jgi:hypothetical protein
VSLFSTAAYVIWNLTQRLDILFLHENKKNEHASSWWDIPLIDWDAYNGDNYCTVLIDAISYSHDLPFFTTETLSSTTKEIYKATRVHNCKVTHHHTSALQYAGFVEGLQPYQVNTLMNCILDKQHSAYQSQAEEWQVSWTVLICVYFTLLANSTLLRHAM